MVNDLGECPTCKAKPSLRSTSVSSSAEREGGDSPDSLEELQLHKNFDDAGSFDTVTTRDMQPMLALSFGDVAPTIAEEEVLYVSPKLDGIRCVVAFDRARGLPLFMTRRGALLECCDHLNEQFTKLFLVDPSLVLDGEIFSKSITFQELSAAVRSRRDTRSPECLSVQQKLQFHVFDALYSSLFSAEFGGCAANAPFSQRLAVMKKIIPTSAQDSGIVLVPCNRVSIDKVFDQCDRDLEEGYEGSMVRRDSYGYQFGRRSAGLLKVKRMHDAEFLVTGFLEGKGRLVGHMGSFRCVTGAGIEFFATPACVKAEKKRMWETKDLLIGKHVTVQFQELSTNGVPRFPIAKNIRGAPDGSDWL